MDCAVVKTAHVVFLCASNGALALAFASQIFSFTTPLSKIFFSSAWFNCPDLYSYVKSLLAWGCIRLTFKTVFLR
jgi:hypothetical protein